MKRFRRLLFNGLAALSLVLCFAMVVLWVRSVHRWDQIAYVVKHSPDDGALVNHQDVYSISTGPGAIEVSRLNLGTWFTGPFFRLKQGFEFGSGLRPSIPFIPMQTSIDAYGITATGSGELTINSSAPVHEFLGFRWESPDKASMRDLSQPSLWRFSIPNWSLVSCLIAFPLTRIWLIAQRRRRYHRGHCPTCGYDLRATPDRCPECGSAPAKSEI
jgi:hypothetical protein